MEQTVFECRNDYTAAENWLKNRNVRKLLIVCGTNSQKLPAFQFFSGLPERAGIGVTVFSGFKPNPTYESIAEGTALFRKEGCDGLLAIGGGSALDVAKCIKLYCRMDPERNYLEQEIIPNEIPFIVLPTTAGTGSEATRFAVIYYRGVKQSVSDLSCIPEAVIFDSTVLTTLPPYQKKATMMDAFSHALESFWSVNSTPESKAYSREALELVLKHKDAYLANDADGNEGMLLAANIAGKAINLTQTTAGHAMCYKITSLFGLSHGHAAALCNRELFPWMILHTSCCRDPRGAAYLNETLQEIAAAMGCRTPNEAAEKLRGLMEELGLSGADASEEQIAMLTSSVNPQRLKNHPVLMDETVIASLYRRILGENKHEG